MSPLGWCVAGIAGYLAFRPTKTVQFDSGIVHPGATTDPRALARLVWAEVVEKQPSRYDRRLLRTFQRQVGVLPSGAYDGATRGALRAFGVPDILLPPPDVRGERTVPYFGGAKRADPRLGAEDETMGAGSSIRA